MMNEEERVAHLPERWATRSVTTPVFPAKAGTHVASPVSVCLPVAIDTATPPVTPAPPPVIPAEAGNHVGPQPPGTWTPAFAGETELGRPPPPVIPAEAGNHVGPQPPGTWTPAFAPHPSFRRKPETTSAPNPQGRGPRLSPGRRSRAAGETELGYVDSGFRRGDDIPCRL